MKPSNYLLLVSTLMGFLLGCQPDTSKESESLPNSNRKQLSEATGFHLLLTELQKTNAFQPHYVVTDMFCDPDSLASNEETLEDCVSAHQVTEVSTLTIPKTKSFEEIAKEDLTSSFIEQFGDPDLSQNDIWNRLASDGEFTLQYGYDHRDILRYVFKQLINDKVVDSQALKTRLPYGSSYLRYAFLDNSAEEYGEDIVYIQPNLKDANDMDGNDLGIKIKISYSYYE